MSDDVTRALLVAAVGISLGCSSMGGECRQERGEACLEGWQIIDTKGAVLRAGSTLQLTVVLRDGVEELRVGLGAVPVAAEAVTLRLDGVEAKRLPFLPNKPLLHRFAARGGAVFVELALARSVTIASAQPSLDGVVPTATCTICPK